MKLKNPNQGKGGTKEMRRYPTLDFGNKKKPDRATTEEDIRRRKTRQAMSLIREARMLGEELTEVWED